MFRNGRGPWRPWRSWRENAFLSSGGWGPLRPWRTLRENVFLPLCLHVFGWVGALAILAILARECLPVFRRAGGSACSAINFTRANVPLENVLHAIRLASLRRLESSDVGPISSLAYFRHVALRLSKDDFQPFYVAYVNSKFQKLIAKLSPNDNKNATLTPNFRGLSAPFTVSIVQRFGTVSNTCFPCAPASIPERI